MKKRIPNAALVLFLCAVWLFPYRIQPQEWGFAAGCFVSFACLLLIPQTAAALIAAAAAAAVASLFNAACFACFMPVLFACTMLSAAVGGKKAAGQDGVFITAAVGAAVCAIGGIVYSFVKYGGFGLQKQSFERYDVFAILAAAFTVFLLIRSLRLRKKEQAARSKTKDARYIKLAISFAAMLAAFAAAGVFYLFQGISDGLYLLPVFLGTYAVVTWPNPVTERLLHAA